MKPSEKPIEETNIKQYVKKEFFVNIPSDIKEELVNNLSKLQIMLKDNVLFKSLLQGIFNYLKDGIYQENVTSILNEAYTNLYSSSEGSVLLDVVDDLSASMFGKIYLYRADIISQFQDAEINKSDFLEYWRQEVKQEIIGALPDINFQE